LISDSSFKLFKYSWGLLLSLTKFYEDALVKKKILPDKYRSKVGIYIYGNSVDLWFFPKKELFLVIKNEELTNTFRQNFEIIWNSLE
jgi:hypothetical protein